MARMRFTKRTIDGLPRAENSRGERYYDTEIVGFGIAVYPAGRKSFFLDYSTRGRRRRITLGGYGALTVSDARDKAHKALAQVIDGEDPLEDRAQSRNMITFSDWADRYIEAMRPRKKHIRDDIRYLGEAKKRWSGRALDAITTEDVERLFAEKERDVSKVSANRWLASVRACLQDAWRKDLVVQNPAMKVRSYPENPPRARVLDDDEFSRVLKAIDKLKDVHARAALIVLIQTGARQSEVLHAKWEDLDFNDRLWRIPSTKAGRPQVMPIPAEIVAMLEHLPRVGSYVVPGLKEGMPRADLKGPWMKIQEEAKVPNVHLHDLRRTFGLHIARRAGLHVASRLLRHSDIRVTERHYAPLGIEELRQALDQRGAAVVPLPKGKKTRKTK
ncbi:MAG: site-specific integrase [Deltaproteobacteria bacterium]|nr:site-specific integrase [Deltaproteobacteria bacterium]